MKGWQDTRERLTIASAQGRQGRAIPYDREHCDGCKRILARGSLRNVKVAGTGDQVEDWEMRCGECIRKGPPRLVGPGSDPEPEGLDFGDGGRP